jgi:osmotically-inducible protein OsmY
MTAATSAMTDEQIQRQVLEEIKWDARLQFNEIAVAVKDGVVTLATLRGEVDWDYQRKEAERVVRNLTGVAGVTNLVAVRSRVQPEDLKQQIERALVRNAETDARRIQVEVVGDRVILTGTVRSGAERAEAERAAWSAPGVNAVENRIVVNP